MDSRRELAERLEGAITASGGIDLRDPELLREAAQALRRQPSVEECLSALKPFADAADTPVVDFRTGQGEVFTPADSDIFPAGLITWGDIRKARQIASLYGGGGE